MCYGSIIIVESSALNLVLLGPLVLHIVGEAAVEYDLRVVVDVAAHEELADLLVQGVGGELHGAGHDNLGGDCVQHFFVFEEYQTGHIGHYLPLSKLFTFEDLFIKIC